MSIKNVFHPRPQQPHDRVQFRGDRVDLEDELHRCDVLVHPSLSEGLGTAVLDAMWAARPVLACSVGGLPELVHDPLTGWLVPPGDELALSERIDAISATRSEHPESLRTRGLAGWQRAHDGFRVEEMVQATRDVYDVCS